MIEASQPRTLETAFRRIDCTACRTARAVLVRESEGWRLYHCECGAWHSIPSAYVVTWDNLNGAPKRGRL